MKEAYRWAGVEFERWFFESEEDHSSVELAKDLYEKNVLKESEGAIGIDLSEDKLGFCILIKSDGNGNYATKDISLAKKKFEEYHIEKSIYVVDDRQAYHFNQIFKTLEKMGFEQSKHCFHLKYNVVEGLKYHDVEVLKYHMVEGLKCHVVQGLKYHGMEVLKYHVVEGSKYHVMEGFEYNVVEGLKYHVVEGSMYNVGEGLKYHVV